MKNLICDADNWKCIITVCEKGSLENHNSVFIIHLNWFLCHICVSCFTFILFQIMFFQSNPGQRRSLGSRTAAWTKLLEYQRTLTILIDWTLTASCILWLFDLFNTAQSIRFILLHQFVLHFVSQFCMFETKLWAIYIVKSVV